MKICLPFCLSLVLGGLLPSYGQVPIPASRPHSFSLDVVALGSGGTSENTMSTQVKTPYAGQRSTTRKLYSTQTQTTSNSSSIQVTVHNFGQLPDTAQVEWYFVASPVKPDSSQSTSDQQFICDQGSKNVSLASNGAETIPVKSADVTSEVVRKAKEKMSRSGRLKGKAKGAEESGSVLSGWMVRVVADGKVVAARGSKQEFEDTAKDSAKLAAMAKP